MPLTGHDRHRAPEPLFGRFGQSPNEQIEAKPLSRRDAEHAGRCHGEIDLVPDLYDCAG